MGFFSNIFGGGDSNGELEKTIKDGATLVDVRSAGEFAGGSAKGAINIPLDQLPNQVNKLKDKSHIVVFCRSGARSGQAKAFLEKSGFTNVTNGGTWQDVSDAVNK